MTLGRPLLLILSTATLALSACAPQQAKHPQPAPIVAVPEVPIDRVVDLLNRGDEAGARRLLKPLLRHTPPDPIAHVLQESLDRDPADLLGPKSFAYTVQPGETMLGLAERFLGNRLKFYQLARYNGIKVPSGLAAGTVMRIPGKAPRPPAPRPAPPREPRAKPTPSPAPIPMLPPKPTAPATPPADPAAARQLRVAGLAALNQGRIDRALALLRRAATLDPDNPLIARDLARAERIDRTVKARH